ncbi:DUF1398 domain-containing protein [Rhodopseudomonas sp.]|uniref:DUF1398 domain-containing protein n=1 Tax=Rhodopseudomonas sp. TaxID=1078 RepID=UPI003B3A8EE1
MTFPQIVGALIDAGLESYAIDFRRATAIYYRPTATASSCRRCGTRARSRQRLTPDGAGRDPRRAATLHGYSYAGFCRRVMAAGCACDVVSLSGRRAVYLGRTAELHVEHFTA